MTATRDLLGELPFDVLLMVHDYRWAQQAYWGVRRFKYAENPGQYAENPGQEVLWMHKRTRQSGDVLSTVLQRRAGVLLANYEYGKATRTAWKWKFELMYNYGARL